MIQRLAEKHNKAVASLLFLSFYISLVSPLYAASKTSYGPIGVIPKTEKTILSNNNPYKDFSKELQQNNIDRSLLTANENANRPIVTLGNEMLPESADFIGGPSQPEMSAFKSAGTNDMVNLFTGDFSYNIPLLDVGGYPINIFYNGGITMEQEASWVGLGWNINPGTISRNMRGVPDDFDGTEKIKQTQTIKPNITWGGRLGADVELVGIKDVLGFSIGVGMGASVNNYLGPALEADIKGGVNFRVAKLAGFEKMAGSGGKLTMSASVQANMSSRNGLTINPNVSLGSQMNMNSNKFGVGVGASTSYNSRTGVKSLNIYEQASMSYASVKKGTEKERSGSMGAALYGTSISFNKPSYIPTMRMPITNTANAGQFQIGAAMFGGYGSLEVEVYKQESKIDNSDTVQRKPMVGFMYAHKANNNVDAIMDFTRFNDKEVTPKTPIISVPQYAYDIFSISGEGTGGTIRAYRNDHGYVRDNKVRSKDNSFSLGVDVGIPGHVGANLNTIQTPTTSGDWIQGNKLRTTIPFREKTLLEEHVYFRNPGETSVLNDGQYDKIGGTDLVRFKLGGDDANPTVEPVLEKFDAEGKKIGETIITSALDEDPRKKRSQVINMLTAEEATFIGLDQKIKNYSPAVIETDTLLYSQFNRIDETSGKRPNHISEINVTETDGKRYVYGLPVYNLLQRDYTVTVSGSPDGNDIVQLDPSELNIKADFPENRDGYKMVTETPPYAHSFLLTGLLSPDFVDVTGNGITEDDLGTAVKFNYNKMAQNYKWRTPYTNAGIPQAHFNGGNLSEPKDDKGILSYGERESWYMHSIESKSMIAVFRLGNRKDGKGVKSVIGNIDTADKSNKRLERIDLYNKSDIRKNGIDQAKPIKTVWFEYDYSLCGNAPGNDGLAEIRPGSSVNYNAQKGKLTLKGIYFTYNGLERAHKNRYVFEYGNTPNYEPNAADRWGNYKSKTQNPQGLKNSVYPYAQQNPAIVHNNAAAWNLQKILLPSGGQLEVTYESDDYAYVQNKHAAVMMPISHTGRDVNNTGNRLYDVKNGGVEDNDLVYISVPEPCTDKADVFNKYLAGINQLAFKLAVNMPKGKEYLTVYAQIEDYGIGANTTTIWVKLKKVDGYSPLSLTAVEYLREHLPGQAFKGYDTKGMSLKEFGNTIGDIISETSEATKSPIKYLRENKKAQTIVLAESFVRLNQPTGKKYGGGHRVKQVVLKDNWDKMSLQYQSTYGQTYDYTTSEVFGGKERKISSGVASYEPSIGGEENPFQEILQVANRLPLGPASYESIEMPVLDAFYPAPLVGYSKVTVRSIKSGKKDADGRKTRSGIGRQVTEFYTAKDFPVKYDYTNFDPGSDKEKHISSLFAFFRKSSFDSRALSQGFLVEVNDMHGKTKSQSSYGEADTNTQINHTRYYYRNTGELKLNEKFDFAHNLLSGEVKKGTMGVDIELMTDTREFSVSSTSQQIQAQVDWMIPAPFPIWLPFIWPVFGKSENYYRAVTTTKLITYHSIVDSIVVIDKGSSVTTKNHVFDAETGGVIVSSSNNEFDRPIYQTSYPAYWAYSGMGPAYKNIDARFNGLTFTSGKITAGIPQGDIKKYFESGDEIYIISGESPTVCEDVKISLPSVKKVWAVDNGKDTTSLTNPNPQFIFIDEKGLPYTRSNVSLRIVRSGKRNMLGAQLASFVSLENPLRDKNGKRIIEIKDSSTVLNASAIEYKEKWQTDKDVIKKLRIEPIPPGNELIVNGNFSSGYTGFTSDYLVGTDVGTYQVKPTVGSCVDHTTGTGNMLVADGHTTAGKRVWATTVVVEPYSDYVFSFWGQSITSGDRANLKVMIGGVQVGASLPLTLAQCAWQNRTVNWNSGAATSVQLSIININIAKPQNDFSIDDISFRKLNCGFREVEDCEGYLEKEINPYRKGLLGTYRGHRSMVFYGERVQGQDSIFRPTNIANNGALKSFVPYWTFNTTTNNLRPSASSLWVWNSEVTRVNARGMELETKDALGIYTAAQYGYAKNLPIAIANNSRNNEMAYAGFEDIDYKEAINKLNQQECATNQHINFDKTLKVSARAAGFNAHTGDGVLKLNPSTSSSSTFDVGLNLSTMEKTLLYKTDTAKQLAANYGLESNSFTLTVPSHIRVSRQGNGDNFSGIVSYVHSFYDSMVLDRHPSIPLKDTTTYFLEGNSTYYKSFATGRHNLKVDYSLIKFNTSVWNGPGIYFHDGSMNITVNIYDLKGSLVAGKEFVFNIDVDVNTNVLATQNFLFDICAGVYKIVITRKSFEKARLRLCCGGPDASYSSYVRRDKTDFSFSYNNAPDYFNFSKLNTQAACTYTSPIKGVDSMLNPVFQIPAGKKMLFSAWVRETCTPPCARELYADAKVQLIFRNNLGNQIGSTDLLSATGPIIEGWQKIEKDFTAPAGATTMEMVLVNTSTAEAVYFDDIRIHPFAANMKSYVYDPINLLLKAELNENNYATLYEYDDEGTLIRKKVETHEGVKTINETRSAKQKDIITLQP